MTNLVDSEYHGHPIVPWAVEEKCYFCFYPASHKVTEDFVSGQLVQTHPYTAYVCCDHFWSTCSNKDAPACPKCKHPWFMHEREIKLSDITTLHECDAYAGMGDWCGCREKKP